MKANEYIKLVGWEYAKLNVSSCSRQYYFLHNGYAEVCVSELKHLVESHELVESYGGLESAKKFVGSEYRKLLQPKTYNRLCEAILDVEEFK